MTQKQRKKLAQKLDIADRDLLTIPRRKPLLDILPSVQHAYDFRIVIDNTIEDDVRCYGKRTQPWAHLVSPASCKRMVFDQRNHFGDFAKYLFRGIPAGGPDVVIPNPFAIFERLGRPKSRAPSFGHLPVLLPDEIVDAGLSSLTRIERADAPVDFRAQRAQLLDMRQQCPPDLLLILGGQTFHFGDGLFEFLDHYDSIPNCSARGEALESARKLPKSVPLSLNPTEGEQRLEEG